jgi:16S rRNA (adenine1518-N6/adenine1519-N6)-dimethyltransferase
METPLDDASLAALLAGGINYDSPVELSKLLDRLGFSMKKRFGQNFMVNRDSRQKIAALAGELPGRVVWEIGPGFGALTAHLLGKAARVRVFEIDHGFIRVLKCLHGGRSDFTLVEGDALKTWEAAWKEDQAQGGPAAIIGNLPYNVGSAIIADMLEAGCLAPRMVFTVQKEVAERMAAAPGDSDYSSFSIHCQARCRVSLEGTLKPGCFFPQPEVTSAVVLLEPRETALPIDNQALFGTLVRSMFAGRRKTLENNIKQAAGLASWGHDRIRAAAADTGIDLGRRAETLSPEDFARWANHVEASD